MNASLTLTPLQSWIQQLLSYLFLCLQVNPLVGWTSDKTQQNESGSPIAKMIAELY